MTDSETHEGRSITVSRVIEGSPERVYEAFLDPDELAQWLPPTGFSAEVLEATADAIEHLEGMERAGTRASRRSPPTWRVKTDDE